MNTIRMCYERIPWYKQPAPVACLPFLMAFGWWCVMVIAGAYSGDVP